MFTDLRRKQGKKGRSNGLSLNKQQRKENKHFSAGTNGTNYIDGILESE